MKVNNVDLKIFSVFSVSSVVQNNFMLYCFHHEEFSDHEQPIRPSTLLVF